MKPQRYIHLVVALSLMAVSCATTTQAPPEPAAPTVSEHWVETDGVRIFYSVVGDRGPAVVVPIGRVVGDLTPLAKAGYRVVLMDTRGRGRSTKVTEGVPLDIETDIADLEAVRASLGEDRVSLIGISYYGALVALYSAKYPEQVDHLIMLAPMAPTTELFADRTVEEYPEDPEYQKLDEMRREGIHESDPPAFCRQYYRAHSLALYSDRSRFDEEGLDYCDLENEWPDNFLQWASTLFTSIGTWDFTEDAAKIRAPALVVQGRQDKVTPPKGAAAWTVAMRNQARLVWMEDCGHIPLKEHPKKTNALILEFLETSD